MKKYVMALLSPMGRLPSWEYWFFVGPIGLATVLLRGYVRSAEEPSQLAIAAVLILMWTSFCVTARRLQDMNYPGLLSFPVFVMTALVFIADIDPALIGDDEDTFELLIILRRLSSIGLLLVVGCGGMGGESHAGPNAYGPPFDAPKGARKVAAAPSDGAPSAGIARLNRSASRAASSANQASYASEGGGVVRPRAAAPSGKPRGSAAAEACCQPCG